MNDILYEALYRYFNALKHFGYKSYGDTYKMLFLLAIRSFIYRDFRGLITEDDYRVIERNVNKVFGTNCLIPFPDFCKVKNMNKLHLGSISELYHLVTKNNKIFEDKIEVIETDVNVVKDKAINNENSLNELKSKPVIKKKKVITTVNDIQI